MISLIDNSNVVAFQCSSKTLNQAFEYLLIFLLCINVQKALSNSTSCPADTYPDVYRGGRRDVNHCTTFVLSKELKTTKNMPETKGDNTLLGKMVNFCKYNFKNGQLLSYLNEEATRYHQYYKYPEKEITVHSGTEVGKTRHTYEILNYNYIRLRECYLNTAVYFNRSSNEISTTLMERCQGYNWYFRKVIDIMHPWWQNYNFSESGNEYRKRLDSMCRCMNIQSESNEYKFATPVLRCLAGYCKYFACVSESYKNCIDERIEQCTFPPNENICREYTYVRHQEAEIPYGKECPARDYGEICDCPCSDLEWSEWSAKSTTCGPYTRERYKVVKGFENVEVDCTQERYKCCFSIEEGLQTDCKDFFINSNKTIMEHNETCTKNGGTIIKTEAGYFCECDDSRYGTLCEKSYTFCEDHPNTCQNGGKCFNAGSSYICSCTSDFQGVNCTIPEITCNNGKECLNGGNCSLVDGKHICVCSPVYTGKFCESHTGLCKKNTCKNGGCCAVLSETHFQCLCARGFKGTLCEEAVSTLEEIAITLSNYYITMVIAICSLVAVTFLYLSGKAVRRHRKRRRARYSKQLKAPKEPKTLSTETNL
ncbi:Delta-like protein 4 [Trichinella patagoniensis]|uniref:Delta-like protein 4 n=2 Tax=Trichinella patagoniensis TaxID=990121 RepID=A0A0V0Z562_9BILA|nr:Delta-like protein 4 [Trichinella patagoniensis]